MIDPVQGCNTMISRSLERPERTARRVSTHDRRSGTHRISPILMGCYSGSAPYAPCRRAPLRRYLERRSQTIINEQWDLGKGEKMTNRTRAIRPADQRPTLGQVIGRNLSVTLVIAVALLITSWLLPGFEVDRFRDALLAGLIVGLFNAFVWPMLAFLLVPLSVYTLGVGNLTVNAALTWFVLNELPGVRVDGFWTAALVTSWS